MKWVCKYHWMKGVYLVSSHKGSVYQLSFHERNVKQLLYHEASVYKVLCHKKYISGIIPWIEWTPGLNDIKIAVWSPVIGHTVQGSSKNQVSVQIPVDITVIFYNLHEKNPLQIIWAIGRKTNNNALTLPLLLCLFLFLSFPHFFLKCEFRSFTRHIFSCLS